jgi:hypothetical protein
MAHINQTLPTALLPVEGLLDRERRSDRKKRKHGMYVALLMLALPPFALAQDKDAPAPAVGKIMDGYVVQQSVEFGGRITSVDGNEQMYDTLVNLHSGPRLFGQELSMRPMTRGKGPFDTLYLSSFGFGGDPNDMARLRVEKGKWYDFVGLYRRDQNYFNFDLFANPLNLNQGIGAALGATNFNPTTMPWYANSPHMQDTTRNMGDFNLTLFPQSAVRIRLGYARNDTQGTLDTTLESPIRTLLTEYDQWRSDRYQFGIDISAIQRTTISIDQFYEHDKVDLDYMDNNLSFTDSALSGAPIDIGVLFPPSGCTPTAANFPGFNAFVPTATCKNIGLFGFHRSGNVRTEIPTTQLSLRSNYFRKLDVTASGTYSSGHSDFLNYQEFANGLGDSGQKPSLLTGGSHTDRVSGNADLGLTYRIDRSWSVSDKFRWLDWRDPGDFAPTAYTCTATSAPGLTVAGAGCAPTASTVAVPNPTLYQTYIAERTFYNTAKLNWAPSRLFSAYLGYRYGQRELTGALQGESPILNSYYLVTNGKVAPLSTNPALPATLNVTTINEDTGLLGVVVRPNTEWRINGDLELLSADNAFTNIGPRHQQRVRLNTTYKVRPWASINGGVHIVETRNDFAENYNASVNPLNPNLFPTTEGVPAAYGHKDHWRYFTLGASLNPNRQFGFDFGWTYLDQLINSPTCVPIGAGTIVLPGTDVPGTPPALCNGFNAGGVPLDLAYQERTNSGYAILTVRPIHRVTLNAGYEITSTAGYNRWLLPGGADGSGLLMSFSDIYGNSPPLAGNPTSPCPAASTAVTGGCAFPGPFPDAPFSQALNWHKPTAGIAIDVAKNVTFKANYVYYDYHEKDTPGLPLVTLPRDFHANTGVVSLKYSF